MVLTDYFGPYSKIFKVGKDHDIRIEPKNESNGILVINGTSFGIFDESFSQRSESGMAIYYDTEEAKRKSGCLCVAFPMTRKGLKK